MAPMDKPPPPSEPEKQTQKAILKRHVDPAGPMVKYLQNRCALVLRRSSPWLQPTMAGALQMLPPEAYPDMPCSSLITRFVASTQNKTRCPVHCTRFAPDSRRVLTGDNSGGISVWNATDFGYMQYLQAHNKAVRDISFTHNGNFVFAADDTGVVKISSINLKPLQDIAAHELPVRAVSASPTDQMFASCSDDNTVKVWDLATGSAITLAGRNGHGGEVRSVDWHPYTSLLASCGRDAMIKLWDTRLGPDSAMLATLSGHKQAVNKVCWNLNGTWLASCSRDLTVKVWDARHTKRELASWQGHARDISAVAWHPVHLDLLTSAGFDGTIITWLLGQPEALGRVEAAHDNQINGLAYHPMGHMLTTCAVDGVSKFWVRPRPGDPWRGAGQREQEQMAEIAAKAAQLPGLSLPAAGGAGAGGGMGAAPSTLPGGISIQQMGGQQQQQGGYHPGQASPASSAAVGPAPLGGRIPGLPIPRAMPLPPGAQAVPGLTPSGMPGGLPLPLRGSAPGRGVGGPMGPSGPQAGGMMVPGLMPGGHQGDGGGSGGPGMMAGGRDQGGQMGGRGRGRGPVQPPPQGGVKRQRGQFDMGYGYAQAAGGGGAGMQQFPGPPKQQQQFHPQMQQHHHQQQQHPGGPPPLQYAQQQQQHPMGHQQRPPPPQFGGRGFGGPQGQGPGRGFGPGPDAGRRPGRGGFPPHPPGERGDFGGRLGGRGYGRGFGRGGRAYQ